MVDGIIHQPSAASSSEISMLAGEIRTIRDDASSRTATDFSALARFELFLFAAIATVLIVRGFLAATGYPQVGGGGLHIAHVLWGGLLLGAAVVLSTTGLGSRVRGFSAFMGGIGFGLFIDEVGKFLTKNVNYFYTPAVAIIYLLFIVTFLVVREIILRHRLSDRQRLALASTALADLVLGQLDERRREVALRRLDSVSSEYADLVSALRPALSTHPAAQRRMQARFVAARRWILRACRQLAANPIVILLAAALLIWKGWDRFRLYWDLLDIAREDHIHEFYLMFVIYTNLIAVASLAIALLLAIVPRLRYRGLYLLQLTLLVDLLFNQFATFDYAQFEALRDFSVELVIFMGVGYLLRLSRAHPAGQERRISTGP
jgi:hypothetical protein